VQHYTYESIEVDDRLPVHLFLHSTHQVPNHWHDSIEVLFVLKGELRLTTGERQFTLREEDLFLFNANEIHAIEAEANNLVLALQFPVVALKPYEPDIERMTFRCNSAASSPEDRRKFDDLRSMLAEMMLVYLKQPEGYALRIQSLLLQLVYLLIRGFKEPELGERRLDDKHRERLLRLTSYVKENYSKPINLQQLASREYLTVPYLSRFFKQYLGTSFSKYVNSIRLDKAVKDMLLTDLSITQIAYETGFPNLKSFNAVFKEAYGQTPGDYRRTHREGRQMLHRNAGKSFNYFDLNPPQAFESLFKYLLPHQHALTVTEPISDLPAEVSARTVLLGGGRTRIRHTWRTLTTFGKAKEGLLADVQEQLRLLQREVGFRYVRFHGIFDDEMMVYGENERGEVALNFMYSDRLFDFMRSIGLRPFLELSFLPTELAGEANHTVFYKKSYVGAPSDLRKWSEMVRQFIVHYINKYGIEEVREWYFEIWNEPEVHLFWPDSFEAYGEFFDSTYKAIKSVHPGLRAGGTGIITVSMAQTDWLERFLAFTKTHDCMPDFISCHSYPYDFAEEINQDVFLNFISDPLASGMIPGIRISEDTEFLKNGIRTLKRKLDHSGAAVSELHLTEWNATASHRDLTNDTCYKAAYIAKNVLENLDALHSFGYWTATDLHEEFKLSSSTFHGGLGLITYNGIPKPAYHAFRLLSKLGDQHIERGEGYCVTTDGHTIQVMLYYYVHYDELYCNRTFTVVDGLRRYEAFIDAPPKDVSLTLSGMSAGVYTVKCHTINRSYGSAFDKWVELGAPSPLDAETIAYLRQISVPRLQVEQTAIAGEHKLQATLAPHEIRLYEFTPLYK